LSPFSSGKLFVPAIHFTTDSACYDGIESGGASAYKSSCRSGNDLAFDKNRLAAQQSLAHYAAKTLANVRTHPMPLQQAIFLQFVRL
jgi:hypothetical protein